MSQEQENKRLKFAFVYYGESLSPEVFYGVKASRIETAEDSHKAKNVLLTTSQPKRAKQVLDAIEFWNGGQATESTKIRLQELPGEEKIITFTKQSGHQDHYVTKIIQEAKANGSPYTCWDKSEATRATAARQMQEVLNVDVDPKKAKRLMKELETDRVDSEFVRGKRAMPVPVYAEPAEETRKKPRRKSKAIIEASEVPFTNRLDLLADAAENFEPSEEQSGDQAEEFEPAEEFEKAEEQPSEKPNEPTPGDFVDLLKKTVDHSTELLRMNQGLVKDLLASKDQMIQYLLSKQ